MYTAVEHIVAQLREEIVLGQLSHGVRLSLRDLADRFQTSPIPVREALRTLAAMGLVELRPHKPAVVANLSLEELEDLYQARILIEPAILKSISEPLPAPEGTRLLALVGSMKDHLVSSEYVVASREHRDIHFGLLQVQSSPALTTLLDGLWQQSERYRHAIMPSRGDPNSVAEEHRTIIRSLRDGQANIASLQLRDHLSRSLDVLREAGIGSRGDASDEGGLLQTKARAKGG